MENKINFPNNVLSGKNLKKYLGIGFGVIVFCLLIFGYLMVDKLNKQTNQMITQNSKITTDNTNNTENVASSTPILDGGHVATGDETNASVAEKKDIGIPDITDIKVLRRDDQGKVTSYEIVKDSNDPDSDNDGITDNHEKVLGTNLNNMDTDGDGISDFQELILGTDPVVANDFNKEK